MRYLGARWLLVGSLALLAAVEAAAQAPSAFYQQPGVNAFQRPTISPYLNLARPGLPAANYFLLVQPQIQQQQINAVYGSALLELERRTNLPAQPLDLGLPRPLSSTGHPTAFVYYGGYFDFGPTSRGSGPNPAAPAPTPAPAARPAESAK